jgi:hypothetical protein
MSSVPQTLGTLVALFVTGCVGGVGRGYPLYAPAEVPLEPGQVARLSGYVHDVDGRDVTEHGSTFELLPGCHVIGTLSKWGTFDPRSGGVSADTGRWVYAIPMKAGYAYTITVDIPSSSAPTGDVFVIAREFDARGDATRSFAPVRTAQDVSACMNGVARLTAP